MKTIGFFGGSFDPIHFGHISLAIQLMENHKLDEVLFCPAFCSPFKTDHPPVASASHRLAMLRLGLEGVPHVRISTVEIERGGPSYTIDTLRALESDGVKLRLLLSEEAAVHLDSWREAKEVIRLAPPLIGARKNSPLKSEGVTPTKIMEISSTEIRDRLKKKLYCGHLIPAKTLDYIHQHHLYEKL